jgi:hypothetical protein
MAFLMQLPTENSRCSCTLPNGAELIVSVRLRGFSGFWTIQLHDSDGTVLTDECPLIHNTNLFRQYIDVTSVYGIFSVEEDANSSVPLDECLNNTVRLYWDYPAES